MAFPNERLERSFQRLRPHGTRARYHQGCRCFQCRLVCARYQRERLASIKSGKPSNRIVSADSARKHLLNLKTCGVGLGTIKEITGIARHRLCQIRSGRQRYIREANERLILSVTKEARVDGTRVPSKKTRQMIVRLNREGFTHEEISKRVGVARGAFLPHRTVVSARTEMKVEKFYRRIMAAA